MTELWPLTRGAKMRAARKNEIKLPIISPNLNIFDETSFIG